MVKLSKSQIASLKSDYAGGLSPADLQGKYGITKRAVYYHINGGDKKKSVDDLTDVQSNTSEDVIMENPKSVSFAPDIVEEDPLIETGGGMATEKARMKETVFEIKNKEDDVFDIDNLLRDIRDGPEPEPVKLGKLVKGKVKINEEHKTPADAEKEAEQERLTLVYQVRLYLYTFKDCDNLFLALNVEQEDKKINKFIQNLYTRKKPELIKLLDFIKFHIRHNNNSIQGNFCSSIFFTVTRMLELILFKVGVDVTGLTADLQADKQIVSNLKEIEIEMTAGKLNVGPKADVLFRFSQSALNKFTQNKLISRMRDVEQKKSIGVAIDKLQVKPINDGLKEKYNDL